MKRQQNVFNFHDCVVCCCVAHCVLDDFVSKLLDNMFNVVRCSAFSIQFPRKKNASNFVRGYSLIVCLELHRHEERAVLCINYMIYCIQSEECLMKILVELIKKNVASSRRGLIRSRFSSFHSVF